MTEGKTSQSEKEEEGSATTVWRGVREEKKNWLCFSRDWSTHLYTLKKALKSTCVDDVSTHTGMEGLIRTCKYTWRSTYKTIEHI